MAAETESVINYTSKGHCAEEKLAARLLSRAPLSAPRPWRETLTLPRMREAWLAGLAWLACWPARTSMLEIVQGSPRLLGGCRLAQETRYITPAGQARAKTVQQSNHERKVGEEKNRHGL